MLMGKSGETEMSDRKTIMSLLEELAQDDWVLCFNDIDVKETAKAALELLKEQEPRVLALEETYAKSICWLDIRKKLSRKPVACRVVKKYEFGKLIPRIYRCFADPTDYIAAEYGKNWRCWSAEPTTKQRRAAKWE